jgi:hypothetical protein
MKIYWIVLDALPMGILKGAAGEVTSETWDDFLGSSICYQNVIAQATWTYPSFASFLTGHDPHRVIENLIKPHDDKQTFGYFGREVPKLFPDSQDIVRRLIRYNYQSKVFSHPILGNEYDYDSWNLTPLTEDVIGGREYGDILKWVFDYRDHPNTIMLYRVTSTHFPFANPKYFPESRIKKALMGLDRQQMEHVGFAKPMEEKLRREGPAEVIGDLQKATREFFEDFWPALWNIIRRHKHNAMIIVCADHGTDFAPPKGGKYFHGGPVSSKVARVPLIIKYPVSGARRLSRQARLIDICPTILEVCSLPSDESLDGKSLRALQTNRDRRYALCFSDWDGGQFGLFDEGYLALYRLKDDSAKFFRYPEKPDLLGCDEELDLNAFQSRSGAMFSRLSYALTGEPNPDSLSHLRQTVDMTEQLQALGYM